MAFVACPRQGRKTTVVRLLLERAGQAESRKRRPSRASCASARPAFSLASRPLEAERRLGPWKTLLKPL